MGGPARPSIRWAGKKWTLARCLRSPRLAAFADVSLLLSPAPFADDLGDRQGAAACRRGTRRQQLAAMARRLSGLTGGLAQSRRACWSTVCWADHARRCWPFAARGAKRGDQNLSTRREG